MSISRRRVLQAGLGLTQVALLSRLGLVGRPARAAGVPGPTRLLTIFMPGGLHSSYNWCPLSSAQISRVMPTQKIFQNEQVYYSANQVTNLDGSGDATDAGLQRLRVPRMWDAQALSAGLPDRRLGGTTPNNYAWSNYRLWENACVVHGVDARTAAHGAGTVGAKCGVPGETFASPSLEAFAANFLFDAHPNRPLANVNIGSPDVLNESLSLRAEVAPVSMSTLNAATYNFSTRVDTAWAGFRDRTVKPQVDFAGNPTDSFATNALDDYALRQLRQLKGTTNARTDQLFQQLYDTYSRVSQQLAQDTISAIERTPGVQSARPFWAPTSGGYFGVDVGGSQLDDGTTWSETFDLALRVLKADVATAVSVNCPSLQGSNYDTHGLLEMQHTLARAGGEVLGRLLGEMKATQIAPGRTLLDDTLVIAISEFARTWPKSGTCDHWPFHSVLFAGGGVQPNRMLGGFAVDALPADAVGFAGLELDLQETTGPTHRQANNADILHTALGIFGVGDDQIFIPGGSGRILGVAS